MKTTTRVLLFSAVGALLGACGYSTKAYREGQTVFPPREANCSVSIYTAPPKGKVRQLGVVQFVPRSLGGLPKTIEEAEARAHPYTCMTGGNGVVVTRNKDGAYSKASIIHVESK